MSFSDLVILNRLNVGILTLTGSLAIFVGAIVFFPIFFDKPEVPVQLSMPNRAPSSVGPLPVPQRAFIGTPRVETIDLKCLEQVNDVVFVSQSKNVRLKGRICSMLPTFEQSGILNRANGFEATLFALNAKQFTTDYIQLSAGKNQITYNIETPTGEGITGEIWVEYSSVPTVQ